MDECKPDSHRNMKQKYKSALSTGMIHLDNHCQAGKTKKVNSDDFWVSEVENVSLLWHFSHEGFLIFLPCFSCLFAL